MRRGVSGWVTLCASLVIGGATAFSALPAQAATCDFAIPRDVVVSVARSDGDVIYDNAHTRRDLALLQQRNGRGSAFGPSWTPVGLTQTELKYALHVKIEAIRVGQGRYCARLTAVDANLGYDRLNVYVARRFPPGTCPYTSITEHELTHVSVFRQALDQYFPRLQRRLERAAQAMEPIRAGSPDAAARRMQRRLGSSIDPLFREMNRTLDRNNAKLDTPQRYRMEQARCNEW